MWTANWFCCMGRGQGFRSKAKGADFPSPRAEWAAGYKDSVRVFDCNKAFEKGGSIYELCERRVISKLNAPSHGRIDGATQHFWGTH